MDAGCLRFTIISLARERKMDSSSLLVSSNETPASLRTDSVSLLAVLLTFLVPDKWVQKASDVKNATSDAFKPSVVLEDLIPKEASSRERDFFKAHEYMFKPSSRDTYNKGYDVTKIVWKRLPGFIQWTIFLVLVLILLVFGLPLLYCFFTMITQLKEIVKVLLLISIICVLLFFWLFYV